MPKPTRAKRKSSGASRHAAVRAKRASRAKKAKPAKVQVSEERTVLPSAWRIGWKALRLLWNHRTFFLSLVAIYLLLDLILVRSVTVFDVASLKDGLSSSLSHGTGLALGGLSVFSSLFAAAASGASADVTGAYHFFLSLLMSLVVIWALRQIYVSDRLWDVLKVKTAFYQSTQPLVPFLLLVFLMGLQILPLFMVLQVYTLVLDGGVINSLPEQLVFIAILLAALAITLVWFSRTLVALYIVTLPGTEPMQAYRQAKELVRGRRLSIVRKMIFLPVALFVIAGVVTVPFILIWPPLAQWLFFGITGASFVSVHAYLYTLYRELLV